MHDDRIAQIHLARQLHEAHFLSNMLADAGIEARVVGEPLNMVGPPANLQSAALWVRRQDEERATRLIAEWEQTQARPHPDSEASANWKCPICGELVEEKFDVCWNCQKPRRIGSTTTNPDAQPESDRP